MADHRPNKSVQRIAYSAGALSATADAGR
jgi:hypothetical protein